MPGFWRVGVDEPRRPRAGCKAALASAVFMAQVAYAATDRQVGFRSFAAVRLGMDVAALEKAIGVRMTGSPADPDGNCRYVAPASGNEGLHFMLIDDKLARIDVEAPRVRTLSGIGLGSTEASIRSTYRGRIDEAPHKYGGSESAYLTIYSRSRKHAIRFETEHGKVRYFYAGTAETVQYSEGCS